MKKTIYIFVLILTLLSPSRGVFLYAQESDTCSKSSIDQNFECRVRTICEQYESPKPVYNVEEYKVGNPIDSQDSGFEAFQNDTRKFLEIETGKKLYRENIGNIYKCAIIQSQKNSLKNIETFIEAESSGRLSDTFGGQIEIRKNRLDISANKIGCTLSDRDTVNNKLNILKETTHEACKYVNYLEYLRDYYGGLGQTFSPEKQEELYGETLNQITKEFSTNEIAGTVGILEAQVNAERAQVFKVFPLAYQAYSEYENNFPIHFLLEMIEADFIILRDKMYATLMPIAQLGIKMINAMSY